MTQNPYAPQSGTAAPLTPQEERTWAVATHAVTGFATAVSAGTLGFIAALVVFVLFKDRGPFVRHHVANALNIQLTALVWVVAIAIFGILTIGVGWFLFAVIPVVVVVLHVLGALNAWNGSWANPPLTARFVR
ncbi:DUF4870 domain-containing protein [Nocardioides jejuensis]|uniref:DUF4870 domain-containing protein n=1 Tax=Nocardioides jejuensis TaxID=2502782 RepID=A0A4R1CBQ2_9ACTN|nr:DUF4870 domain-containing protein [Nocardioides jejuensis]TCJ28340.1 DUF4870 domain-containing protein [Nocardioides jejuensis]